MTICIKRREVPIDYTIDWGRGWIGAAGIRVSRWTVDPEAADGRPDAGDVTVRGLAAGEGLTRATIAGGVPGARYTVRGHVELSDGRTAMRALRLRIGAGR